MLGAGVVFVIAAWAALASPAGAAQTSASANGLLTYLRAPDQATVTCALGVQVMHNTDDPRHPFVLVSESVGTTDGHVDECFGETALFRLVVTYTDVSGNEQRTEIGGAAGANIGGVASNVHVSLTATYLSCDTSTNPACALTVAVAPK
jgi:hypothetical protein